MKCPGALIQIGVALGCSAWLVLAGPQLAAKHLRHLQTWRQAATMAPEGASATQLFERAVEAGAIRWDPSQRRIVLRKDMPLPPALAAELFKIGEAGIAISAEIERAAATNSTIALRVRRPGCSDDCPRPEWRITAAEARPDTARALALGATLLRSGPSRPPSPRLNAALSSASGSGYGTWQSWNAQGALVFQADLAGIDRIDVIGTLLAVPPGWKLVQRWCRDARGRLGVCGDPKQMAAARLQRAPQAGAQEMAHLVLAPVQRNAPGEGRHRLTERLALTCDAAQTCRPSWIPRSGVIAYARPTPHQATTTEDPALVAERLAPASAALGPWAQVRDGQLTASDMARESGAAALLGQVAARDGGLLASAQQLTPGDGYRVTLDPQVQRIANDIVDEITNPERHGVFGRLGIRFPADGPKVSLVVLDLRDPRAPGAILAASGTPVRDTTASGWDLAAAGFTGTSGTPPGAPAWTGRGSHHIPGSTWKLVSAVALIDAATDPAMPQDVAADLTALLHGTDSAGADRLLAPGLLTSTAGICPHYRLGLPPKAATSDEGCGIGYLPPIRDSGRGGPLRIPQEYQAVDRTFGLSEAVAKSSNIWFAAMLLKAEAAWHAAGNDFGGRIAHTAERLGLRTPLALDSGLGLALLPRDASLIEALSGGEDVGALARAAYGQQVQAGPLVTAQVAASIATGMDVRPSLLRPLAPAAPLFSHPDAMVLLDALRHGMALAVQEPRIKWLGSGTAYTVFAPRSAAIQPRVFGKTGTAHRGGHRLDRVSTFAGWLENPEGQPQVAVGCSATLRGIESSNGKVRVTRLCAHATAALMTRLEAAGFGS